MNPKSIRRETPFLAGELVPCMVEVMPQRNYTQRLGAKGHDKKVLSYAAVCDSASDLEHLNDAELNPIRVRIALRTASLVGGEELMELRLHSLVEHGDALYFFITCAAAGHARCFRRAAGPAAWWSSKRDEML